MGRKTHNINGVNWASVKKFAKHTFGDENVKHFAESNRVYFVYLNKETFYGQKEEIERFEKRFLVVIKEMN